MDKRVQELLDSMESIEAQMVQYIKDNASRLRNRLFVYEAINDVKVYDHIGYDRVRVYDRRFFLNPEGRIEEDRRQRSPDVEYEYERNFCVGGLEPFVREFKDPGLKQVVKALGDVLGKIQTSTPV